MSDIDIFVEFSEPNTIDLFDFIDLKIAEPGTGDKSRSCHKKGSQAPHKGTDTERDNIRLEKREHTLYLADILEAIEKVQGYAEGVTPEDFRKNLMVQGAIIVIRA